MARLLALIFVIWASPLLANPYKITVLSTNIADYGGLGEWSFSAVFEGKTDSVLFDTGFRSDTVLHNVLHLGVDLSSVEKVVLSHVEVLLVMPFQNYHMPIHAQVAPNLIQNLLIRCVAVQLKAH